jgi:FAD:protein FMN transferase
MIQSCSKILPVLRPWFKSFLQVVVICACAPLLLAACANDESSLHQARLVAFGTLVDISTWGVDDNTAEQAIAAVESSFNDIDHTWHAWHPSTLTQMELRLAKGEEIELDADKIAFFRKARMLSDASDQLFNPAIGKLIALWGFNQDDRPQGPPPDLAAIKELLALHPTMDDLVITATTLKSNNPAVRLDFGGFAKGFAVDQAINIMRAHGISNAIINAGGDLRAIGNHGSRPWHIGIRHPRESGIIASVETGGDESVFTSGTYERFFDYQGVHYHHIIDPRSGYPAKNTLSVTVIHNDAATADAAATAMVVAGPGQWQKIAARMGVTQVMLIDNDLTVYMTPAMARRIHFEIDPPPKVIIGNPT